MFRFIVSVLCCLMSLQAMEKPWTVRVLSEDERAARAQCIFGTEWMLGEWKRINKEEDRLAAERDRLLAAGGIFNPTVEHFPAPDVLSIAPDTVDLTEYVAVSDELVRPTVFLALEEAPVVESAAVKKKKKRDPAKKKAQRQRQAAQKDLKARFEALVDGFSYENELDNPIDKTEEKKRIENLMQIHLLQISNPEAFNLIPAYYLGVFAYNMNGLLWKLNTLAFKTWWLELTRSRFGNCDTTDMCWLLFYSNVMNDLGRPVLKNWVEDWKEAFLKKYMPAATFHDLGAALRVFACRTPQEGFAKPTFEWLKAWVGRLNSVSLEGLDPIHVTQLFDSLIQLDVRPSSECLQKLQSIRNADIRTMDRNRLVSLFSAATSLRIPDIARWIGFWENRMLSVDEVEAKLSGERLFLDTLASISGPGSEGIHIIDMMPTKKIVETLSADQALNCLECYAYNGLVPSIQMCRSLVASIGQYWDDDDDVEDDDDDDDDDGQGTTEELEISDASVEDSEEAELRKKKEQKARVLRAYEIWLEKNKYPDHARALKDLKIPRDVTAVSVDEAITTKITNAICRRVFSKYQGKGYWDLTWRTYHNPKDCDFPTHVYLKKAGVIIHCVEPEDEYVFSSDNAFRLCPGPAFLIDLFETSGYTVIQVQTEFVRNSKPTDLISFLERKLPPLPDKKEKKIKDKADRKDKQAQEGLKKK